MSFHYSNDKRAASPNALPDIDLWYWDLQEARENADALGVDEEDAEPGWYYWICLPGCLPDTEPFGPFASKEEALADAAYDDGLDDEELS